MASMQASSAAALAAAANEGAHGLSRVVHCMKGQVSNRPFKVALPNLIGVQANVYERNNQF
jgi:hypothetical protein